MNFTEKIKLAFYNLWARKKTSAQCIAMISFIMLLVFISTFFISTLIMQLDDSLDNYASKNYIKIQNYLYEDYSLHDTVLLDKEKQKELKSRFSSVTDINYYKTLEVYAAFATEKDLIVDGIIYKGNGANSSNWPSIIIKDVDAPTFSTNMFTEFSKKFPNQKLIKYGRDIQAENEVLFPEEFLAAYKITPEQLLSAGAVTFDETFKEAKVVGITNANITMLEPDKNGNRDPFATIIIYVESNVNLEYGDYPKTFQQIELDGSKEVDEITGYISDILGERYIIWYGNYPKKSELELINKILIFVQNVIIVLFGVVGIALIVFLYSVMAHNVQQKASYLGMMRAMGQKSNFGIMLLELTIMTLISSIICLIFSFIAAYALGGAVIYISWGSSYTVVVNPILFALTFLASLVIVFLINTLLAFLSIRKQNSKTITAALRS